MEPLFTQRHSVISTNITPWILGIGCRTPEQAKKYIKYGETLNPSYYPVNRRATIENGEESVYNEFMQRLFNDNNIDDELTQIIGDNVYKPWDCLSGIYQIQINEGMGLVARPDGITNNNECVIMKDNYITYFYGNQTESKTEKELKIKLLSTMAVWKANKGVFIITKMDNRKICIDFDKSKWEDILNKIKLWAN